MLQPLQLRDVSGRYAREIAEVRDFMAKAGVPLDTADTLRDVAAGLREDRAFRRDMLSHLWAVMHSCDWQISYSDLLGILALAGAGNEFAAAAGDREAQDLLRFVMDVKSGFDEASGNRGQRPVASLPAGMSAIAAARALPIEADDVRIPFEGGFEMANENRSERPLGWIAAVACLVVALLFGTWFHFHTLADRAMALAPVTPATSLAAVERLAPAETGSSSAVQHHARPKASGRNSQRAASPTRTVRARTLPPTEAHMEAAPVVRSGVASVPVTSSNDNPMNPMKKSSRATPVATVAKAESPDSKKTARLLRRQPAPPNVSSVKSLAALEDSGDPPMTSAVHHPTVRPTSLGIMAANVLDSPAPAYPQAASALHVQGEVKLEAEVDRDGNVVSTRIISGPPLLRDSSVAALQSWHYRPYLYDGKPIAMNATVVFDYQLP